MPPSCAGRHILMYSGLERPVIDDPLGDQIDTEDHSYFLKEPGSDTKDPVFNGGPSSAYCVF